MDYKELIDILQDETNPNVLDYIDDAVTAINDLLARVEAAENERDRLREAMKPNCLQCESMHKNGNCMEVGGFCTSVPAAHCPLIPKLLKRTSEAETRAEKAERERDYAIKQLKIAADENGGCWGCKWLDDMTEKCTNPEGMVYCNTRTNNMWEWRGLKEE